MFSLVHSSTTETQTATNHKHLMRRQCWTFELKSNLKQLLSRSRGTARSFLPRKQLCVSVCQHEVRAGTHSHCRLISAISLHLLCFKVISQFDRAGMIILQHAVWSSGAATRMIFFSPFLLVISTTDNHSWGVQGQRTVYNCGSITCRKVTLTCIE